MTFTTSLLCTVLSIPLLENRNGELNFYDDAPARFDAVAEGAVKVEAHIGQWITDEENSVIQAKKAKISE